MTKHRQFTIAIVLFGCVMGMLILLWQKEYFSFYSVLIGLGYFILDRVIEKEEKS